MYTDNTGEKMVSGVDYEKVRLFVPNSIKEILYPTPNFFRKYCVLKVERGSLRRLSGANAHMSRPIFILFMILTVLTIYFAYANYSTGVERDTYDAELKFEIRKFEALEQEKRGGF
jgi:hypothetical protein